MTVMKTLTRGRTLAAAAAVLAVLGTVLAIGAVPAGAAPEHPRVRPDTVAIALGALETPTGGHTWLSLQAGSADGVARGDFRYYCPEAGYYNGAVRSLTVTDGAVHAEGAGGLARPDGTRIPVRFTLDIAADGSAVSVHIEGADYAYDMTGSLDGFLFAGSPPIFGAP